MVADRCRCGAVQGSFAYEYPFVRQGVMHSPLGCLRGERHYFELQEIYKNCTGFEYYGNDLTVLFQIVMSALDRNPEIAKATEGLVLEMVPCHDARAYVPAVEKPPGNRGSRGGGGVGRTYRDPTPPPWLPASGNPKPPWEK